MALGSVADKGKSVVLKVFLNQLLAEYPIETKFNAVEAG